MTPERRETLINLYLGGRSRVSYRLCTEIASWFEPELEQVAERRYPEALDPLHEAYGELVALIRFCETADEVAAVVEAFIEECRSFAEQAQLAPLE